MAYKLNAEQEDAILTGKIKIDFTTPAKEDDKKAEIKMRCVEVAQKMLPLVLGDDEVLDKAKEIYRWVGFSQDIC